MTIEASQCVDSIVVFAGGVSELLLGIQLLVDLLSVGFVDKIGYCASIIIAHGLSAAGLIFLMVLPEILPAPFVEILIAVMVYAIGGKLGMWAYIKERIWDMELEERIKYAKQALDGIALGDCFGQTFFVPDEIARQRVKDREILKEPWYFTDDTVMAIGIYRILEKYGEIKQDELAKVFAENYALDWHRGYGGTAHSILRGIGEGRDWREVAREAFDGMGSMGNGGAMRAAPIGAYFADDLDKALYYARASAEVTHAHIEGIAGAMAAAAGAALLLNKKLGHYSGEGQTFLSDIADKLPESDTKYKILSAASIKKDSSLDFVVSVLGNGIMLTAQDTVPFSLWCGAYFYASVEEALWTAVSALGDRDTICAIVGGMVALYADQLPPQWSCYMERPEDSEFFRSGQRSYYEL